MQLWWGELPHFQIEKRYRRNDGSVIWVRNMVALAPGTEKVSRFAMAIVEDITEDKHAEDALHYSLETLNSASRRKTIGGTAKSTSRSTAAKPDRQRGLERSNKTVVLVGRDLPHLQLRTSNCSALRGHVSRSRSLERPGDVEGGTSNGRSSKTRL